MERELGRGMVRRAFCGTHGQMGEGKGEFWERVHVVNRLVRDMLVEKTEIRLSFRALVWPVTLVNPRFVGTDTDCVRESDIFFSIFFFYSPQRVSFRLTYQHLSRGYRCATRYALRVFFSFLIIPGRFPLRFSCLREIRIEMHSRDLLVNESTGLRESVWRGWNRGEMREVNAREAAREKDRENGEEGANSCVR